MRIVLVHLDTRRAFRRRGAAPAGLKGIFFKGESEHERPGTDEIADNL